VQSPYWEANWFAASQEIPRISRNPKVHYRTHNRPPPVPILGQPNPVHIPTSHLLQISPNFIHPSTPRSPLWSLSLRFPQQDPIQPPLLTHTRQIPNPSHSSPFYHPHDIGWGVQIISSSLYNLLHSPRYLVPPRSKYSPQHLVLKHPQPPFLPQCQRPSFTPIQYNRQNYSSIHILICIFLDSNLEDKRFCTEWQQAFPDIDLLLISSAIEFWFVKVFPKYLNSSTLSKVLKKWHR